MDRFTSVATGSQLRRVVFSLLGLWGLVALIRPGERRPKPTGLLGWAVVFAVAWSFASVLWTADFALTSRRLVSFGAFCLASLAIARQFSPRNVGLLFFFSSGVFVALNFLAEVDQGVFSPLHPDYRFTGVEHPNSLGMSSSFLILSGLVLADSSRSHRRLFFLGAAVGLVFLVLTKSRTSFACAVIALLAYKKLTVKRKRQLGVMAVAAAVLVTSYLALGESAIPVLGKGFQLGREGGDISSLNGRTWVWMECRRYIGYRPVAGYGFNGFWSPERMAEVSRNQGWVLGSAHSAYFDVTLNLGVVGLGAFLIVVVTSIVRSRWAFRETRVAGYAFMYCFLIFYVLQGFLESIFVRPGYFSFMSMVVFACLGFWNQLESWNSGYSDEAREEDGDKRET